MNTAECHILLITDDEQKAQQLRSQHPDEPFEVMVVRSVTLEHVRDRLRGLNTGEAIERINEQFIRNCRKAVEENLSDPKFGIPFLSSHLGMSHSALYKKIKALTGMSLIEFINDCKISKAIVLFHHGETNIESVAYKCGINDPKNFRTLFKRKTNMTPTQYVQSL